LPSNPRILVLEITVWCARGSGQLPQPMATVRPAYVEIRMSVKVVFVKHMWTNRQSSLTIFYRAPRGEFRRAPY